MGEFYYRQATLQGFLDKNMQFELLPHIQTEAAESAAESGVGGGFRAWELLLLGGPALPGDRAPEDFAPLPAPSDTRPLLRGPPPPLPATGKGFKCLSRRCRDKLPYATAAGYIQHLNQQHKLEAHSLCLPNRVPDIVKCRDCNRSLLPECSGSPGPPTGTDDACWIGDPPGGGGSLAACWCRPSSPWFLNS